jgi:hypothetical protein
MTQLVSAGVLWLFIHLVMPRLLGPYALIRMDYVGNTTLKLPIPNVAHTGTYHQHRRNKTATGDCL